MLDLQCGVVLYLRRRQGSAATPRSRVIGTVQFDTRDKTGARSDTSGCRCVHRSPRGVGALRSGRGLVSVPAALAPLFVAWPAQPLTCLCARRRAWPAKRWRPGSQRRLQGPARESAARALGCRSSLVARRLAQQRRCTDGSLSVATVRAVVSHLRTAWGASGSRSAAFNCNCYLREALAWNREHGACAGAHDSPRFLQAPGRPGEPRCRLAAAARARRRHRLCSDRARFRA